MNEADIYKDPVLNELFLREETFRLSSTYRVQEMQCRTELDIRKKEAMEAIETVALEDRKKIASDIASKRLLHKTKTEICRDGKVRVCQELFAGEAQEFAPFRFIKSICLQTLQGDERSLYVMFERSDGKTVEGVLDLRSVEEKEINRFFNRLGIRFGFSHRKESECRAKLVAELLAEAEKRTLPDQQGWYRKDGKLAFAFPEEITWRRLEKNDK